MKNKNKIYLSLIAILLLANNINAKDINKLDSITVTAQKSEESIKDVPISMSVFNEFTLEDRNIDTVMDIAKYTPGLEIVSYGAALKVAPSIRGMFSDYSSKSSVAGLFIDGIPVTDGTGYDETLLDIERVEVLKGPQGTLYGKNTEVGAINIITKKPDNETKTKIKGTFGSDNKKELSFNASTALVEDKFYIGITGKHYEKDGFVKNYNTGKIVDDKEHDYARLNFRWTPTDNLELSLISSKVKYDDGANSSGLTKDNPKEVGNDLDAYNKSEVSLNALNINYKINEELSILSTTAYRKYHEKNLNDFDYTNDYSKRFHQKTNSTFENLSQEIKLNYESNTIKLVSGLFYEQYDVNFNKNRDAWWGFKHFHHDQNMNSLGVFSHLSIDINDKLSILGGLRFDKINQEYKDSSQTIKNDENEISPKIGFTYDLQKNMMLYSTIAKGYRAGGFNATALTGYSKTYDKETLYSYEIGLKGSYFSDKLNYDLALYYMDISNMQVDFYINASNVIKNNAAEATSKGIEASLNYQITNDINLFGGFSYNNISLDKYHNGKEDYSGKTTMYSPKYNFNLGVLYRADNGYYASVDISGYGDTYFDTKNEYKRDAYELVNIKLGYETNTYDIYVYAKNLFDKEYHMNGVWGGTYSTYSAPREIGVQVAYRF